MHEELDRWERERYEQEREWEEQRERDLQEIYDASSTPRGRVALFNYVEEYTSMRVAYWRELIAWSWANASNLPRNLGQ